jgi:integrase
VREAVRAYLADRHAEGQNTRESRRHLETHVLPHFGTRRVAGLKAAELKAWRDALAETAPRVRRAKGARRPRHAAVDLRDAEVRRRRRSTVNRIATTFKAALNHAARLDHEAYPNREAWRQGLKAFRRVERARGRWLARAEVARLVAACIDLPFRCLVLAALYTGCRYGELRRARVGDYAPELPALRIPVAKSGRWRDVFLHDEAAAFFTNLTAGRAAGDWLLERAPGIAWGVSQQARRIAAACKAARIAPAISFHGLRHTYASLSVQAGMALIALARNLGHADTRMVEKHYGHLSDRYMREQVVRFAPALGAADTRRVTPPHADRNPLG